VTTGEGVSTLEHLAEMDRVLRDIQMELAPGREPVPALSGSPPTAAESPAPAPPTEPPPPATAPAPPTEPPPPATAPAPPPSIPARSGATRPAPDVQVLTARLLASMRELLDGYEQVLVQPRPPDAPRPAGARSASQPRPPATPQRVDPDLTMDAGPFASVEALNAFERSVAGLPGVRDVAVRGYEGTDRAIIEVRLDHTSP
jgi:hypothetical protein